MKIKKPEPALAKPRLSPDLSELMKRPSAKNSWAKKLISEDSDFEEPQTLQDFGPFISSAKDLADYLLERGFIQYYFTKDHYNRLDICVKYSTEIKIEQKRARYPHLIVYKTGIYKEVLNVYIGELSNNQTRICVAISINPPYYTGTYLDIRIHNTHLQNIVFYIEGALSHLKNAQKYIDSGKELWAMLNDIRGIFKPLNDARD